MWQGADNLSMRTRDSPALKAVSKFIDTASLLKNDNEQTTH